MIKFYRFLETNEIYRFIKFNISKQMKYELITKKDSELMIDEFWYPKSTLRNEKT